MGKTILGIEVHGSADKGRKESFFFLQGLGPELNFASMPEITIIGLVGAIFTFLAVNLNLYWVHRSFQSSEFRTLNHNFSKVKKYWSLEQGRVLEVKPDTSIGDLEKIDYKKATRSAFLFGTLMIFLSWLGLFIFLLYFFSTHKFAKSRFEQRIFASELVKNENLDQNQIQHLLLEMESLGR
jgi:hypothetical protein